MVRCSYFTIECDIPIPDWTLTLKNSKIPFFVIGLSGIVFRPLGNEYIFETQKLITDFFRSVEKNKDLFIDSNYIWIPDFLFDFELKRGDVYRLTDLLFIAAYKFRKGKINQRPYLAFCQDSKKLSIYSAKETSAFRQWQKQIIDTARRQYPKNSKLVLKYESK
jgi:hypothetical protein